MYIDLPIANNWLPIVLFLLGLMMATSILLRRAYRNLGRRKKSTGHIDAQPRPSHPWDGAGTDQAAQIDRQKVELEEYTREASGQIDSKILVLRELIAQSDRRIETLERLLDESARGESERAHSSGSGSSNRTADS